MRTKFKYKQVLIYGLIDPQTQQIRYIGKSIHVDIRFREHLNEKRQTNHKQNWIQSLLRCNVKPELIILETVNERRWKESEQWWISYFLFLGAKLTNIGKGGEDNSKRGKNHHFYGKKHSEETRRKMREAHRNRAPLSEESRRKLSESLKARPSMSDKQRQQISQTLKGRKLGPHSETHKANLSKALKGKKRSSEQVERIRQSQLGIAMSEEAKRKISMFNKGKIVSQETRMKMSEARKQWHKRKHDDQFVLAIHSTKIEIKTH